MTPKIIIPHVVPFTNVTSNWNILWNSFMNCVFPRILRVPAGTAGEFALDEQTIQAILFGYQLSTHTTKNAEIGKHGYSNKIEKAQARFDF